MRVLIVGAGIGGIALALTLRREGIDYVVLEQASELSEVGAGIQLSSNGVRVLDYLGVAAALEAFVVEPGAHVFRHWKSGDELLRLPLCPQVREAFGAPYYHAHRADLLGALVSALDGQNLRLGCRVVDVAIDPDGAEVELQDGSVEHADVVAAADGIHSLLRDRLFSPEAPVVSGYAAWRGLIPAEEAERLGIERHSYIWLGPGRSMVLYYVSAGRKVNWVGITRSVEATKESWSQRGTLEAALVDYDGWHDQIVGLIKATEEPFVTQLFDREALASWVSGRAVLLGDAAHAMLPYHAQGAVQSLEDAWVLGRCLSLGDNDLDAALARYEELRRGRATEVQAQSRAAQQWYHYTEPEDLARREARFRGYRDAGGQSFSPQQEWLYSYDAERAALGTDEAWRRLSWRSAGG